MDVTHYAQIRQEYEDTRLVIGQIFLDNYDEVTSAMNDKDISNLGNFVTNALADWAKEFGIYLKRVDEDHFFIPDLCQDTQSIRGRKIQDPR